MLSPDFKSGTGGNPAVGRCHDFVKIYSAKNRNPIKKRNIKSMAIPTKYGQKYGTGQIWYRTVPPI